jgi:hypothetical protein
MRKCHMWTDEECIIAKRLHDSGMSWREVGLHFGRSRSATQSAVARFLGFKPANQNNLCDPGEPIGLEMPEISYKKDCRIGSATLRTACLDLFQRTAGRYHISMSDAMACHLGYHAPPKLIRSPYGTQSALRSLAA